MYQKKEVDKTPNSPDNGSIYSYNKDELSIYKLNQQLQDNVVKNVSERNYNNIQHGAPLGQNSPVSKFRNFLIKTKRIVTVLEMEYEMTNLSDNQG